MRWRSFLSVNDPAQLPLREGRGGHEPLRELGGDHREDLVVSLPVLPQVRVTAPDVDLDRLLVPADNVGHHASRLAGRESSGGGHSADQLRVHAPHPAVSGRRTPSVCPNSGRELTLTPAYRSCGTARYC